MARLYRDVFPHHLLKYFRCLLFVQKVIPSFILLGSPAIPGPMSPLVAVVAAKLSSLSSVIVALSLGLSLGFLWEVSQSLFMCPFVTCVTIPQGIECVLTICIEYGYPGQSRVDSCIDDWSVTYWGCDHVNLHPDLSFLPRWFSSPDLYGSFSPVMSGLALLRCRFQFLCTVN